MFRPSEMTRDALNNFTPEKVTFMALQKRNFNMGAVLRAKYQDKWNSLSLEQWCKQQKSSVEEWDGIKGLTTEGQPADGSYVDVKISNDGGASTIQMIVSAWEDVFFASGAEYKGLETDVAHFLDAVTFTKGTSGILPISRNVFLNRVFEQMPEYQNSALKIDENTVYEVNLLFPKSYPTSGATYKNVVPRIQYQESEHLTDFLVAWTYVEDYAEAVNKFSGELSNTVNSAGGEFSLLKALYNKLSTEENTRVFLFKVEKEADYGDATKWKKGLLDGYFNLTGISLLRDYGEHRAGQYDTIVEGNVITIKDNSSIDLTKFSPSTWLIRPQNISLLYNDIVLETKDQKGKVIRKDLKLNLIDALKKNWTNEGGSIQ